MEENEWGQQKVVRVLAFGKAQGVRQQRGIFCAELRIE